MLPTKNVHIVPCNPVLVPYAGFWSFRFIAKGASTKYKDHDTGSILIVTFKIVDEGKVV